MKPKVTIGMPTFNRAKYLKRSIDQVLSQSYQNFELIIYNDGSTDETVEVLKLFTDKRITFVNESNKGLPHPLNKVLDLAQGEYIIILHDHDIFNPKLIEKSVHALDEHPGAAFVFQGSAWINSDNTSGYQEFLLDLPFLNNGRKFGEQLLLKEHEFSSPLHACCMVRKSAYMGVGKYYDEKYGWYCDLDLWLRLLIKYDFIYLKEILFTFTEREKNHLLSKKSWLVNEWMYQTHKKHLPIYFTDDLSLRQAEKILEDKRNRTGWKSFIHSLVSGDKNYLQNSIIEFSKYEKDNKFKRITLILLTGNITQTIVLKIGAT